MQEGLQGLQVRALGMSTGLGRYLALPRLRCPYMSGSARSPTLELLVHLLLGSCKQRRYLLPRVATALSWLDNMYDALTFACGVGR